MIGRVTLCGDIFPGTRTHAVDSVCDAWVARGRPPPHKECFLACWQGSPARPPFTGINSRCAYVGVSSCHQHTHAKPPRFMQHVLSYSSRLHCLLLRARTLRTPHAQCNKTPQIGPLSRRAASSLVHSRSSISCTDIPITTRAHMRAYTYDAYLVRPWRLEVYSLYTTVYFVFSNSFFCQ
jgi:hypothetical protein